MDLSSESASANSPDVQNRYTRIRIKSERPAPTQSQSKTSIRPEQLRVLHNELKEINNLMETLQTDMSKGFDSVNRQCDAIEAGLQDIKKSICVNTDAIIKHLKTLRHSQKPGGFSSRE